MADNTNDKNSFTPAFAMPLIAPPPDGYDTATYYSDVASQTTVTATPVEVLPEQQATTADPLEKKGMLVTVTNPDATFQSSNSGSGSPSSNNLQPFGTLFALMGGELRYLPSTSPEGLNPLLPSPFSEASTPIQYPPPDGLVTTAWGTLALTLWWADFNKLQTALDDNSACQTIYYVGVDEGSLAPLLKPAFERIFTQQAYSDHLTAQSSLPAPDRKKAVLRDVVETVTLTPYATDPASSTPTYDDLVDAFMAEFVKGTTSLMVKGGTPIAKAVQSAPAGGETIAQIELWFVDAGAPQQFMSPVWIFAAAPTYEF